MRRQSKGIYTQPRAKKAGHMQLREALRLRPAGGWSRDLLNNTTTGKLLAKKHEEQVEKLLTQHPLKSKQDVETLQKKLLETPAQKFVLLYEASLCGPLNAEALVEYMTLFKQLFPEYYKQFYKDKTPSQVAAECLQSEVDKKRG